MASASGTTAPAAATIYYGMITDEDIEAQIQAVRARLTSFGLATAQFSRIDVNRAGFTTDRFLKHVKIFTSIEDEEYLDEILTSALLSKAIRSVRSIDLRDLISLCKWLRTSAGQAAATKAASRTKRIQKRMFVADDPEIAGRVKAHEVRLEELRRQMRRVELEMQKELDECAARYFPASNFKEPSSDELGADAFAMYEEEARSKGQTPMPLSDAAINWAVEQYGKRVRQQRIVNFVKEDAYREPILDYLRQKILAYEAEPNMKQAEYFRAILALAGGTMTAAQPTEDAPAEGGA